MPFLKNRNTVSYIKNLELISKRNGLRHAIFNTVGDKYIGEWKDDLKTGKGKMLTRHKELYEGDFLEGYRHGFGVLAYKNEKKNFMLEYRGHWRRGKMCGFGMRRYRDGGVYIGNWKNSKRHGYGLMWYPNGEFYAGEWIKDKRHGVGMLVLPVSFSRYEGQWMEDYRHGIGKHIHLDNGQVQNGVWRFNVCVTSHFVDIKYRQTAPYVTAFPIQELELLNWEEIIMLFEKYALEDRVPSCLALSDELSIKLAE